jgi:hypothetical protein
MGRFEGDILENVWSFASLAGRSVALAGAVACYYGAILLYPDEQGRIQNKLEEWWIDFDDRQRQALSRAAVFMRGLAALTSKIFDAVFGQKLISLRAVVVSAWLTLTSSFLTTAVYFIEPCIR